MRRSLTHPDTGEGRASIPCALKGFRIENYFSFVKTEVRDIPDGARCIIVTGENGAGKTVFLRAISAGLSGQQEKEDFTESCGPTKLHFKFKLSYPETKGEGVQSYASKLHGLNRENGPKLDLGDWVRCKKKDALDQHDREQTNLTTDRLKECAKTLIAFLPDTAEARDYLLRFTQRERGNRRARLGSGYGGIVALVEGIITHLFMDQPGATSPAELEGIILIDEIEAHLHPNTQTEILHLLTREFPKIQFIVTTNSALPLIGAPDGTVFLKVTRTKEDGTKVSKLDVNIKELLPTALLTSPLFDMGRIVNINAEELSKVHTEETYKEVEEVKKTRADLKEIAAGGRRVPEEYFKFKLKEIL